MSLRLLLDGLLTVLLAPCCAACGGPLERPAGSPVCDGCWRSITPLRPPFCAACGEVLEARRGGSPAEPRCPRCGGAPGPIRRGFALGEHDGALRGMLHALKYDRRKSIARGLSVLMRERGTSVLDGADMVVPVPLHWARRWRRGFNQSAELAAGLGLPVVHALARVRHTRSQTELPAARRQANVRAAFRVRPRAPVPDACIVLVDDVSTTGATIEACALELVRAGAREVRTLTAARALTRPPTAHPR